MVDGEIIHFSSEGFQTWIEDYLKRRYEKKGLTNVSVGCPCPHGEDVWNNIQYEQVVATVLHDDGEFFVTLNLKPWHEAYVRVTYKSVAGRLKG